MSLSQIIRRYLLKSLLIILILGCVSIFFIFKFFIHHSTDQILYEYKQRIEKYVAINDTVVTFNTSVFQPQRVEQRELKQFEPYYKGIKDTLLYNEMTGGFYPYRQLYFTVRYQDKNNLIILTQPTIVLDDLLLIVVGVLILLFCLLFIFIYSIDSYLKRKAWLPFGKILNKLGDYRLGVGETITLERTNIKEFEELNEVVDKMVTKINADYENIKTFSEDISHEMQTPLAIIKSKLELIRQSEIVNPESLKSISTISKATTRLTKLNQSLLLLIKIRNNQFQDTTEVNMAEVIGDFIEEFNELIEAKGLVLRRIDLCEDLIKEINPDLAEILISNLLSNAIKHNVEGGNISIYMDRMNLVVENTCEHSSEDSANNLFERMENGKSKKSIGLGLNIVKSICSRYSFDIFYSYPMADTFSIVLKLGGD